MTTAAAPAPAANSAATPATPATGAAPNGATADNAAASAPTPEVPETYVVDGKEVQLTKHQARMLIQKAGAVDRRLQEATEKRNNLENLLKAFEADPEGVLKKLGKDPKKIIEGYLKAKADQELMTPEQREKAALEKQLAERDAKLKEIENEKLTAQQRELDTRNQQALEQQLLAAAEKAQLDKNPETMELMCDVAIEAIEMGSPMTAEQIAQEVIYRQQEHVAARDKKVLSRLSDDKALLDYLGPDVVKRVLKASLTQVPSEAAKAKAKKTADGNTEVKQKTTAPKYVSEADFDREVGLRPVSRK